MREVITQFFERGKATMSSTFPYRANWFQEFNGLLSQIKNLMLTLLKHLTISENHVYETASKTREPQRNTNVFNESTSNWHLLLKYFKIIRKGGHCSKVQYCRGSERFLFFWMCSFSFQTCIVPSSLKQYAYFISPLYSFIPKSKIQW